MIMILYCLIFAFIHGTSCLLYFETIVPKRTWHHPWVEHTIIPAFMAGMLVISFTRIPPYILQPVRLIIAVAVVAQIYFQMHLTRNLILSVLYCSIYWSISTVTVFVFYFMYDYLILFGCADESIGRMIENLTEVMNLCLMIAFHAHYKDRTLGLTKSRWQRFSLLPFVCLTTIVAFNLLSIKDTAANRYASVVIVCGIVILNSLLLYFSVRMLEKEEALQKLQLRAERTRSQMSTYHTIQLQYEQQKRLLHDYKNQLNCIQGLLDCGQTAEASKYITRITGNLRAQFGDLNTNHTVVNIILNQKHQTARKKGIGMTLAINDLSKLTMQEEDLVSLLTNLLDNAIEACERLDDKNASDHKIIQFKMVIEEDQLILSVRNPVNKPVQIKNNTVVTSKKDSLCHGIGLSNVHTVVKKYHGTSVLTCEDGWFSFAAMFPCPL